MPEYNGEKLAETNIVLQMNGNIDHSIFRKIGHRMLAPTENLGLILVTT
jgi:hypothetical protein